MTDKIKKLNQSTDKIITRIQNNEQISETLSEAIVEQFQLLMHTIETEHEKMLQRHLDVQNIISDYTVPSSFGGTVLKLTDLSDMQLLTHLKSNTDRNVQKAIFSILISK